MLRKVFGHRVLGAGVVQLVSAIPLAGAIVAASLSVAQAQPACVSAGEELAQTDAASGDGWACGEPEPDLDLSTPAAVDASALAPPKNEDPRLPLETPASGPLPVVIAPAETGAGARASLQTVRDYNAQIAARKAAEARAAALDPLPMPKSALVPKSAVDIWSSLDAQGFDAEESRKVKAGAGLDFKVVKNASVGVTAERSEQAGPGAGLGAAAGEKVSAYVAFQALPSVSIDARTQWERAQTSDAQSMNAAGKSSIIVAPRVAKAFVLEDGHTLEPYVEVKREIDLNVTGDPAEFAPADSAGAGVNFGKTGSYAVNVTTGVSGMDGGAPANVSSKVQLKVPLD